MERTEFRPPTILAIILLSIAVRLLVAAQLFAA